MPVGADPGLTAVAHVLDDVAWHALAGPHAHLADTAGDGAARRYRDDIAPFCGVERLDSRGWAALSELVGPRGVAVFLRGEVEPAPTGWTELLREPATQYVAGDLAGPPADASREVRELTASDSADMVALTAATEPGPFGPNSHLTGRWFGVRREGRLVAMAGERMRVDGFGEVSGVCVDPSARGEGLGAVVTLAAAHGIRERGDRPMLHVRDGNDVAHRLYRWIGFEVRRTVAVVVVRRDAS
ncbi:MAG TPA: GNAT family N-acetyltransferase [Ornithinibacter sp.]|nr:GNAT family N-acetyltransferase [Ornithinibacter sp.]